VNVDVMEAVLAPSVSVRDSRVPISITVDDRVVDKPLEIAVRTPNVAQGWKVDPAHTFAADKAGKPAVVKLTGAASTIEGLHAVVTFQSPINANNQQIDNATIEFIDSQNKVVKWPPATVPPSRYDPLDVPVVVKADRASSSKAVNLRFGVSGQTACGFRVTSTRYEPSYLVTISGPDTVIATIDHVDFGDIDVNGASQAVRATRPIVIPGVAADPNRVTVILIVEQAFSCVAPSPSPVPSPRPTPTP
jgi:hypothetical protein